MARIAIAIVAVLVSASFAQVPNTQAMPTAPAVGKSQPIHATVVSVSGDAQKMNAGEPHGKWTPIKAGDVLDEMAVIRTGLGKSGVVLKLAERGEVTVNNGTKIGISELRQDGAMFQAKIGLKYGTIHAKVEKSAGPNDVKVTTPVATMAVRGSDAAVSAMVDAPGIVESYSGVWKTTTSSGSQNVQPGQAATSTLTQWVQIAQERRDPGLAITGMTGQEKKMIVENGGGRGIIGGGAPSNSDTGTIAPPSLPVERRLPPTPPGPTPPPTFVTR